jgi:hypothetical protein
MGHAEQLMGNGSEINNYTTAVTRQWSISSKQEIVSTYAFIPPADAIHGLVLIQIM